MKVSRKARPPGRRSLQLLRHGALHRQPLRFVAAALSRAGTADAWLVYAKDLSAPLSPYAAAVPLEIDIARDDKSLTEAAALFHHARPDRVDRRANWFRRRTNGGSLCFVARVDGRMVAYNWTRIGAAIGAHSITMRLASHEIYTTDAYTARAWRGKGIHTALNYAMLRHAQAGGYRTAYTLLRVTNLRSWITMPRLGWEHVSTLLFFRPDRAVIPPLWYVWGDPYPMPLRRGLQRHPPCSSQAGERERDDEERVTHEGAELRAVRAEPERRDDATALSWAQEHFPHDSHERLGAPHQDASYRLVSDFGTAYLKVIPTERATSLRASAILARRFAGHVPDPIAVDPERGWLLTRDHEGSAVTRDSPERCRLALIETYARIQCACRDSESLAACLPRVDGATALAALLDLLDPDRTDRPRRAAQLIGEDEAREYHRTLHGRRALLEAHMRDSHELPDTINHCNLSLSNTAITPSGRHLLLSWDDAAYGPAGLSIHALFGGCATPNLSLCAPERVEARHAHRARLLDRYIETLVRGGYAEERTLRRCLPAAFTVGAVRRMTALARGSAPTLTSDARERLERRLRDLIDLCDLLSARNRETALAFADDHLRDGRTRRAQRVVEHYLVDHPRDAPLVCRLGSIQMARGSLDKARDSYHRALAIDPTLAEAHQGLGRLQMAEMNYGCAAARFRRTVELDPTLPAARAEMEKALRMEDAWAHIRSLNSPRAN